MTTNTLIALTPDAVAAQVRRARRRVVYAAPGLTDAIATALIHAAKTIGIEKVRVVVDPSPEVCRLGYGQIEPLEHLQTAGIDIGRAPGLRIACVCVDDQGWIFALTPLLIEAGPRDGSAPNAVRVEAVQVERLVDAIAPSPLPLVPKPPAEIGIGTIEPTEIAAAKASLETNPPRQFDLARLERVFNSAIEFVELELKGLEIQRKVVRLPPDLVMAVNDDEARARLDAAYRLIDRTSALAGTEIRKALDRLRKIYLTDTRGFGKVILRSKRPEFEAKVEQLRGKIRMHKAEVETKLQAEIDASRGKLIEWLVPGMVQNPPLAMTARRNSKVDDTAVRVFLEGELRGLLPDASKLVGDMKLDCRFKAVTYATLTDEQFWEDVKAGFPDLEQLMDEYDAARADAGLTETGKE